MESLKNLYKNHIATLQRRVQSVLARDELDALLIHSGENLTCFLDDHPYPFKANPHFNAWVPVTQVPHCWLWVDGVNKPKLWFYSPVDYWHSVDPLPESFWTDDIDIVVLKKPDDIAALLPKKRQRVACISPSVERAMQMGIVSSLINPQNLLNYLHYHRAFKTDYELFCLREAQKIAVAGHRAAREAFLSGMSEYDINQAYLRATGQRDTDVPYGNIIALNEHAAVLHYTRLDRQCPNQHLSFLIDAGAQYNGYAADITRSYAAHNDHYGQLVADMNREMLSLLASLKAGNRYTDYHQQMNFRLAGLLKRYELVNGLSEETMVSENITGSFMPHGIGHLLGLQVHDVAGFMQDEQGRHLDAPSSYPWLRCTRMLQPRMVLTIEPGIYFIDSLLCVWKNGQYSANFNWSQIEALKPYGGIRIEDNVIIHDNHIENMTRDLRLD